MKTTVTGKTSAAQQSRGFTSSTTAYCTSSKGSLMSGRSTRTRYSRYRPFGRTSAQFDMCWAPMSCRWRISSGYWRPSS